MNLNISEFIDGMIMYDYVLFGSVFVLFILFIVLGIKLRKKTLLAALFILLAFGVFFGGPTYGYVKMHEYLFKNSVVMKSQQKLTFTQAVVIKGSLTNESNRYFDSCTITAYAYKVKSNALKNYVSKLKPFQESSIIEYDVAIAQTIEFKMIVEPFTYERDYNVSLGADCR